ncbi:MAG: hypothetical protein LBG92_02480 [Prevotellaceae bacterium]|jgi:hypothetical protein|nr:hypothetical protein [Prevotellaceae bacterium]
MLPETVIFTGLKIVKTEIGNILNRLNLPDMANMVIENIATERTEILHGIHIK